MRPIFFRLLVSHLILATGGCIRDVTLPAGGGTEFRPIAFFEGHTHGDGELHKLFSKTVKVSVDSIGRVQNGTLILEQTIRQAGKPASMRTWTIIPIGHDHYSGTLTEAAGEVHADVVGAHGYIHYITKDGLTVDQQLAQQSDCRTVLNLLVVHKLGVRVATLSETIRKSH